MNVNRRNLKIGKEIDGYPLNRFIGEGTFGVVFETVQPGTKRRCAIKIGTRESVEKAGVDWSLVRKSLLAEGEIMANLDDHPNILVVYAAGEFEGFPYVVMELMDSGLEAHIGRLEVKEARNILLQMSRAVKHLHDNNYIHQDIKPSNILLKRHKPGETRAKLADLGTAKYLGKSKIGYDEAAVWTPGYVDAEVATGRVKTSPSSDIYSLGATFYHVLTGIVPDLPGIQPPNRIKSNIPRNLSDLIMDMMAN